MKPYADILRLTEEQHYFYFCLSSSSMVIERAFGMLKGRWRFLGKRSDESHTPMLDNDCAEVVGHYELTACNRRFQSTVREAITGS